MTRVVISVSIPDEERYLLDAIRYYAKLERTSDSDIFRRAVREYVDRHGEGNPQKPLIPGRTVFQNPVTENRREILTVLLEHIQTNPGQKLRALAADFGRLYGRTTETAATYIRQLQYAGKVVIQGANKVYAVSETGDRNSQRLAWKTCSKPVTPYCQHCPHHFDCDRYREYNPAEEAP